MRARVAWAVPAAIAFAAGTIAMAWGNQLPIDTAGDDPEIQRVLAITAGALLVTAALFALAARVVPPRIVATDARTLAHESPRSKLVLSIAFFAMAWGGLVMTVFGSPAIGTTTLAAATIGFRAMWRS